MALLFLPRVEFGAVHEIRQVDATWIAIFLKNMKLSWKAFFFHVFRQVPQVIEQQVYCKCVKSEKYSGFHSEDWEDNFFIWMIRDYSTPAQSCWGILHGRYKCTEMLPSEMFQLTKFASGLHLMTITRVCSVTSSRMVVLSQLKKIHNRVWPWLTCVRIGQKNCWSLREFWLI
jgi:hypothetical protein